MITAVVVGGWATSSRRRASRISTIVREELAGHNATILSRRAMIIRSRRRSIRRYILGHQQEDCSLLLVGKSYGALMMIRILNSLSEPLEYHRIGLLTVDPNWPTWSDWRPNLGDTKLHLDYHCRATNLRAIMPPGAQAGAQVIGLDVLDVPLRGATHHSIVRHPRVRTELRDMLRYLTYPHDSAWY